MLEIVRNNFPVEVCCDGKVIRNYSYSDFTTSGLANRNSKEASTNTHSEIT
jgi:hypothetical protein